MKFILPAHSIKLTFILIFLIDSTIGFGQTQEATLHFNDGTSVVGYGLIFQRYKIKFRANLEDEPDVWDGTIVNGITFHGFEYDTKFGYIYAKNHERYPLLLEVLTEGEVTLYANIARKTALLSSPLDDILPSSPNAYAKVTYYVKRPEEPLATKLKGRFKKCVIAYFGECSGIIKGIDQHKFRWTTMIDLVNYYNDFCVD